MTLTTNQKKRRTLYLIAVLGLNAWAQDGGVISDAPKVTILPGDSYLFNKAAFDVTNAEMKRLQGVERLHKSEQWRDRLIAQDDAFGEWVNQFPGTDTQQLRALVRQARKDAIPVDNAAVSQGLAPRQGRAYRELFQFVREQLTSAEPGSGGNAGDESDTTAD